MPKKCFLASIEIEMLVFAETEDEARQLAREHFHDEVASMNPDDFFVSPATHYPAGWEPETPVYHAERSDLTARDALAQTPEFVAASERLRGLERKTQE